jgi:hypothetical protein
LAWSLVLLSTSSSAASSEAHCLRFAFYKIGWHRILRCLLLSEIEILVQTGWRLGSSIWEETEKGRLGNTRRSIWTPKSKRSWDGEIRQ